jgi:hypothetical protein
MRPWSVIHPFSEEPPITDLALTGRASTRARKQICTSPKSQAGGLVGSYLGATDPKNPLASPLFADLTGLRWMFGWECRMGSSPMSADSTPLRRRSRQAERF